MKKIGVWILFVVLLTSCGQNTQTKNDDTGDGVKYAYDAFYDPEVNVLNLQNQNLEMIPDFSDKLSAEVISEVTDILLSTNQISEFDEAPFEIFPALTLIDLGYNQLIEIEIQNLNLEELLVHKNKISDFEISNLENLRKFDISYNELTTLQDKTFPSDLVHLELQHNLLEDILGIQKLQDLETLKLEFNNLTYSDITKLANLKNLKHISTKGNDLSDELVEKLNEYTIQNK